MTVGGMAGNSDCRDRPWFKRFNISAIISLVVFLLIVPQTARCSFLGDYKAVFETSCQETVTLKNPLPQLHDFLVCVYLQLASSVNPWTAFTYKVTPSDSVGGYDLGLAGDSGSLIVWMFGNQIVVPEKLNLATWYLACIQWESATANMTFSLNGVPAKWKQLNKPLSLAGGGILSLGCSQTPGMISFGSVGLIGELYMFRMWDKADQTLSSGCSEGNTIRWDTTDWNYNGSAFQLDRSLHCAKAKKTSSEAEPAQTMVNAVNRSPGYVKTETGILDRIGRGLADSGTPSPRNSPTLSAGHSTAGASHAAGSHFHTVTDITTYIEYYNHTEVFLNISSNSTLNSTVTTTYNISHVGNWSCSFDFTDGMSGTVLPDNVCDLSTVYNSSDFYNIKFRITSNYDNSSEIEKNINYIFSNPAPSLVNSTCLANMDPLINSNLSSFLPDLSNQTVSSIVCTSENNGSMVQCTGLVKLCRGMRICNFIAEIWGKYRSTPNLEIRPANFCCCMDGNFGPAVSVDLSTLICYENKTYYTCIPGGGGGGSAGGGDGGSSSNSEKPTSSGTTKFSSFNVSRSYTTLPIIPNAEDTDNLDDLDGLLNSTNLNASIVDRIVSRMEGVLAGNVKPKMAGLLVGVVSKLLNVPPLLLAPVSKRLIMVVDNIGLKLNFSSNSVNFTSPSLALAVTKINASMFREMSFAIQNTAGLQVDLNTGLVPANRAGSITLPSSVLDNLTAGNKDLASRIQFNFFEKTSLFQDPSLLNQSLISYVISAGVSNLTISNLTADITVTLRTSIPANQDNYTLKCVFWDFTKNNGSGGWGSDGCAVACSRGNETVCKCNHLTSFGVLLDLSRSATFSPLQVMILTFITYIGCGLSAIFLSITLVTYIAFEKIRRDYPSQILIQLCAALLCLNLTFLLDSWIALYNAVPGLCISVAVFLHYFLLVTFTWMGLEAFHMYLSLVKVFNTYVRKYILKFCIVGWGLPAIVVAIVVAISKENYGLGSYGKYPNGSPDEFCWISSDVVFYVTVVGYFCFIFLLNVGMFIVVLIQLCRIKKKKQLGNQRRPTFQDLRSVAGLTFLLGITWGFAFFAWGPVSLAFMYLFCIFNTLQGFFIFIFYCVAKENVRKQWRRYLCCGRFRLAENSDWSRTATNFLKKQAINQGVSGSSNNSIQSNSNGNSTNSATLLVNNEYSGHQSGNGHLSKEKNGVSFILENGDVSLQAITENPEVPSEKDVTGDKTTNATHQRTFNKGRVHIIDQ